MEHRELATAVAPSTKWGTTSALTIIRAAVASGMPFSAKTGAISATFVRPAAMVAAVAASGSTTSGSSAGRRSRTTSTAAQASAVWTSEAEAL